MGSVNNDLFNKNWNTTNIIEYWGHKATNKHVVQVYDSDEVLIDALEGFARSGLNAGESVIFIARKKVLNVVNSRLVAFGSDTGILISESRLFMLEASAVLSEFMVEGVPDPTRFNTTIGKVIEEARGANDRKVRAYGEMVSLLWQQDNKKATIGLEELWNQFCSVNKLTLFCAYPIQIFERVDEFTSICKCHHHMLNGSESQRLNVLFTAT